MASILDQINAEVDTELSQQPQEEKPKSVLEDVKQEVSAEPQNVTTEEPKTDFFESAEKWLEPAPTQKTNADIFLGLISKKRAGEISNDDKEFFNALSDEDQYKAAQARKDIPLDDAQARRIFEVEKSKMPSIPTSWSDWYNLGGDAWDTAKNVFKIGAKVGLGATEFGRDIVKATDMTVSDEEAAKNAQKAKSSFYSFMAPAFEIPEDVLWMGAKAKEGGLSWADALGEKMGLVSPEKRFENWKGRRLVSQAQAEYFREHPTIYGRLLDSPIAKDALTYIAKSQMESPEELAKRNNISIEEAKSQQDAIARQTIDQSTSEMESELPEEKGRVRIAGEFLLPGEVGMGTMGAVSLGFKSAKNIAQGLKYIGKSADEIAEINKAAQILQKSKFAEMMKKRTERAETIARGAGKIEEKIQGFKPIAEKATGTLAKIAAPTLGGIAGYSVSEESPMTGILTGALGGAAARSVLKGTKLGLELPTFVREVAESRKVAPLGKTFETLGKSAEGSGLKAKILSRGGKTIDNILSNSVEYARTGIHGTTLALATGALESADPEEMKQMLSDGLAITLGGRALQHIKGKMMGGDPVIAQRERISDDSRIHRRYQEADPETQANLDQISDFDNAIQFRQKKLADSELELTNAFQSQDAAKIKLAQSTVETNKKALDQVKRANVQTRNEFGREFLKTYSNLQDITNGVLKTGQNNVGFNILSTDQIYQKLRNDPTNRNVSDSDIAKIASQAGFYSNPAQEGVSFDRKRPSIVLNADSIRERIKLFGESPTEALNHETSHFIDLVPEFQNALSGVRSMLFQNEIRDAAGNIKATTPGIFSKAKLVELFNDGYLRHLDPQGKEAFSKLNNLWDESRGQLDENKVANYMKSELMADLLGEVSSRHLSKDLDSSTLAMWDRARIKAKKNLLDRAIDRFYGFGGRGDIVTAANTGAQFPPEAMAAARDAMRQIVALNAEISPPVQEPDMPAISKAQMMKNSALLNRFGKDSPLFKSEFKVKVFDKDGNQIGESMPVTTPNPREGTFQSTDAGMKKLSGYGDIPVEAQGLQVPDNGTLVVSRDLVMQPDGVTPVMYDAKDAKKVAAERKKLITEALDTDDYGTPNRFEPVAEGSETYRGTFTPAQIKAIQDMPESLVPKTLKENMLKVNEAIARGDGTRFIVDYAAVMNDNGKYQAFSPKMYDLVPIGMHLSKGGNFLVTTISVGRIFDKMRLWNERMPGRLRFWDNNLERTFDDFTKYLNNWQQGNPGETGLDADPQVALQKKNIFNDLLNLYDKSTEYSNFDRTTIPRRKGDPRNKDANRTIMSIRVDHIAELLANENATKLPVNYGFAKINFMPERMEGEAPTQEKIERIPEVKTQIKGINLQFMPQNFDAIKKEDNFLLPLNEQPENLPVSGRLTAGQKNSIDELESYYKEKTPERIKKLKKDAEQSLASRLVNIGIPVADSKKIAAQSFADIKKMNTAAMQVISGMGMGDLSRMAGTGRPSVETREGINPSWLTSAFESFETDDALALMKAQQVARQLTKADQVKVAAGEKVESAKASGVRESTKEQGMSFVIGEKTADQKAFGSSLREDRNAPPRVYASVVEGQKFGSQGNYNLFFEWDKNTPMVITSHHHYGVGNGLTDIHASANIGDKNARSFGDVENEKYDTLPSGKKILDTYLLVGNDGASDIRTHQLMVSIPSSGIDNVKRAFKANGIDGAKSEIEKIVATQLVGQPSQGKTQTFTSSEGVPPYVAVQKNRTEAYVLNPDLSNVKKITIVSNNQKEIDIIKKNLAKAFDNNGSKLPEIKIVSAESGASKNPGRKTITDKFFNATGKIAFMPERMEGEAPTQEPIIREKTEISPKIGADYMKAVESGDVETQQKLVDESIKKAGELSATDKLTKNGGWLTPSGKWINTGIHAHYYGIPGRINNAGFQKLGFARVVILDNKLIAEGWPLNNAQKREANNIAIERGIDFENRTSSNFFGGIEKSQIKTAEPIAYDKDGNVIPLSQRFNPKTSDIRFMPERPAEERIVSATYTDPRTGEVREGVNHKVANPNAPDEQTDRESRYYGFKTDTGRVVDREEAYRIAEASGQLKKATSEEGRFNVDRGVLHSNMVEMEPTIGEKTEISPKIGRPTISEKPQSSEIIGADTIKPADLQTSAKPEADAVIKPFSNALVSSAGLINFLPAYHGTPFDVDKFKLANIGTGEGAQAYGWGLYFAQARKVGEEYRDKLSKQNESFIKNYVNEANAIMGKLQSKIDNGLEWSGPYNEIDAPKFTSDAIDDVDAFKTYLSEISNTIPSDLKLKLNELIEVPYSEGNLYKVDIDVKDEDLLDWDGINLKDSDDLSSGKINDTISKKILGWESIKSIEDFEQKLKDAEREFAYGGETGFYNLAMNDARSNDLQDVVDYWAGAYVNGAATGERIYNYLSATTSPKQASEYLNSIGIPGIRYLDGTSRKQGEGTHNYVVFDENLITILDKNDKPVAGELPTKQTSSGIQFMPARKEKEKKESLKIRMTKEALTDAALNQSSWKDWYKEHQDVLDDFFGDHAELFQEILAVTSQAASVKANVGLALKAFGQLMRGEEFDARLRGEEKAGYLDGVINNLNAIKNKTGVSGRKISNYKAANEGDVSRVVVDRHITRLLFGVDTPSKAQYDLAEKVLTEIANDIGWEPSQVQAALWAHSIVLSGKEPESYGAYLTKLESNPLTKKEIASGLTGNQLTKRIGKLAYAGQGNFKSGGGRGRYSKDGETKTK